MSEIRKGDLVMVLRSHCTNSNAGEIHTVQRIDLHEGPCNTCHEWSGMRVMAKLYTGAWAPLEWLKKIDPLAEPEVEVNREERSAPVSKPELAVSK